MALQATRQQTITSEKTSINHVPRLHKLVDVTGKKVLDYGCGRYTAGEDYLYLKGAAAVASWDPWNRDPEMNVEAAEWVYASAADIVLCSNVLNVIQENEVRAEVIQECYAALRTGQTAKAYFTVYAGDRSGVGKETTKGWQENRKVASYLSEVAVQFDQAKIENGILIGMRK